MNDSHLSQVEGTDLEPRDVRALTECMTILPKSGDVYTVVGENRRTYTVDAREGRCTCPDYKHNLPTEDGRETCKHAARVTYAAGMRPVPAWVDRDAVDELLAVCVAATPRVVATDGGQVFDEESGDAGDENDRPDDCECHPDDTLPCFACWMAGYQTPNSAAVDGK